MNGESTEIQIGRLDERVKALDKKLDANTNNFLDEIRNLRENFAGRLQTVEAIKLAASDFITYKGETAGAIDRIWVELKLQKQVIERVKDRQIYWSGVLMVLGIIIGFLAPVLLNRY